MQEEHTEKRKILKKTSWTFRLDNKITNDLNIGDRVFFTADFELSIFTLFTLNGDLVTQLQIENSDPDWIFDSNIADYIIKNIKLINENYSSITLQIEI